MLLTKSDYMQGLGCIKSLWLTKYREDIVPEIDVSTQNRFEMGKKVQEIARLLYPQGFLVEETLDMSVASLRTQKASQIYDVLFEATAKLANNACCRIDIMQRNANGWDLIEIKSATEVKPEYIDDLAFQKYIFENSGYLIYRCKVLYLNNQYVRQGDIDIKQLFILQDVTDKVIHAQEAVPINIERFLTAQARPIEPQVDLCGACKKCPFFAYCGKDLPEYSIFNLPQGKKVDDLYATYHSFKIEDLPPDFSDNPKQLIDSHAYLEGEDYFQPQSIQEWLNSLIYPLYYLDYETVQCAIPLFDRAKPYSQIPFQFSLHIQMQKGGNVEHIGFLHRERTDPRRALAECLVQNCGQKGSVVVYNQTFEKTRNKELAELFPDLSDRLLAINERVIDQLIPFRRRFLYSPQQKSSASIKYVLPAFCDLSYKGMEIANGGEAMSEYQAFLENRQTPEASNAMFEALDKYCAQDTLAMVKLMDVLYFYAQKRRF